MKPGNCWGVIGIVILFIYYLASILITTFISDTSETKIAVAVIAIVFALLTIYAGSMAYKNDSKILGVIDILLGLGFFVIIVMNLLRIITSTISNMPAL
jgi:hypothetical protein